MMTLSNREIINKGLTENEMFSVSPLLISRFHWRRVCLLFLDSFL